MEGFNDVVVANYNLPIQGNAMVTLGRKIKRLQPILKRYSQPVNGVHKQLEKARSNLIEAHHNLS